MALPWIRVENNLVDHPKVFALAATLKDPNAGWYVIRMWSWTSRYAARGRLADGARTALETACGWRGQSGALVTALIDCGFLDVEQDGLEVHDWWDMQGQAVEKAEKDAERKRQRRADGAETARGRRGDGAGTRRDVTRRNETGRITTLSDQRVSEVFAYWAQVMAVKGAVLSPKRQKAVESRLAEGYDVEALKQAIDGCARTPHNMGHNDRGTKFNDLELICRSPENVDRFKSATTPVTNTRAPVAAETIDWTKVQGGEVDL